MDKQKFSSPLSLRNVQIKDAFWKKEMELVRTEVIPYQWAALNDQVEGAAPSYCMHNFKAAGKQNEERREQGKEFREPVYTFRGFETLRKIRHIRRMTSFTDLYFRTVISTNGLKQSATL